MALKSKLQSTILDDLSEQIVDSEHKTAPTQSFGTPYVRTPNVKNTRLILDDALRVSEETYKEWTQRIEPKPYDIILCREAPVGDSGMILPNQRVCLGQRTVLIRPNKEKVYPKYLLFLLNSPKVKHELLSNSGGTHVDHLNMKDIRNLKVEIFHSYDDQKIIGNLLFDLNSQIYSKENQNKVLEQTAQAIFKSWFIDFDGQTEFVDSELGEIPKGWEVKSIGSVIELVYGKSLTKKNRKYGTIPVYGSSGVVGYHNESLSSVPGIIVGRKGNVGSVYWSQTPFYAIDTVYYVKTDLSLQYVYQNFQNQNFINSDSSVPGLQREQAYSLSIIIPEKPILDRFEKIATQFRLLFESNKYKINCLTNLRDYLLPKLMSGEIRI